MPINILGFDIQFNPRTKAMDHWVSYAPKHAPNAITRDKVSRLTPPETFDERHQGGIKEQHMTAIWSVLGPAYEAWLRGQEIPEHGLPIEAWPGLNSAQVAELRKHQVRTVEDLAGITDGQIQKISLPSMHQVRRQAQEFLSAKDGADMAAKVAEQEDQMKAMREQMEAMRAEMEKPKRGRPRKAEAA